MSRGYTAHTVLLLVAAIWGFAFVAQSAGMDTLGPHSFNAARFLLGTLSLLPLYWLSQRGQMFRDRSVLLGGLAAGTLMFGGMSFQQIGLQYTTAGNAGFITGMYIVLVPLLGLLLGQRTQRQTWVGVFLAFLGLAALSIGPDFTMRYGDLLELIGAFFWSAHVLLIAHFSRRVDALGMSVVQMIVAGFWATLAATFFESNSLSDFQAAWLPLVYAGVASGGIAYTLQVMAQRHVPASVAALIMSTEAVFALIGGWWLLDERLGTQELLGCGLMLVGIMVSQWPSRRQTVLAS